MQQRVASAWASIVKDIDTCNWVWRLTWVEVVLYCADTAQNKREGYTKVM